MQAALLACDTRKGAAPPAGLILHAAAIDATRTSLMLTLEPVAQRVRRVAPGLRVLPKAPPTKYHRDAEEVRSSRPLVQPESGLGPCLLMQPTQRGGIYCFKGPESSPAGVCAAEETRGRY